MQTLIIVFGSHCSNVTNYADNNQNRVCTVWNYITNLTYFFTVQYTLGDEIYILIGL